MFFFSSNVPPDGTPHRWKIKRYRQVKKYICVLTQDSFLEIWVLLLSDNPNCFCGYLQSK